MRKKTMRTRLTEDELGIPEECDPCKQSKDVDVELIRRRCSYVLMLGLLCLFVPLSPSFRIPFGLMDLRLGKWKPGN